MLQCTAVARLPAAEALAALRDMSGGPDDADDHLADMAFVLCELGVHDQGTDHAARLWTAEEQPPVGLWFMWTEVSRHMGDHYFATFRLCPYWRDVKDSRDWCNFYKDHPEPHGFHVSDPLRDLIREQTRLEAQRRFSQEDPDEGDDES
ncbi:hypothetical protein ACF1D2_32250 [Streptomyces bacillaris]|uniref:hypothetical protein n=1 Tax=Streptomyces bacillaris TaxID=68179 RepID=UPI0036C97D6F